MKFTFENLESRCAPCSLINSVFEDFSYKVDEGGPSVNLVALDQDGNTLKLLDHESFGVSVKNGVGTFTPPPLDLEFGGWTDLVHYHILVEDTEGCVHNVPFSVYVVFKDPVSHAYDINGDNILNVDDIDILFNSWSENGEIQDYDRNGVGNFQDLEHVIKEAGGSSACDSNLSGDFGSTDLIQVMSSNTYERNVNSTFSTGDWNADGRTTSQDLVFAFSACDYQS